jgi:hypothetical protein
MLRMDLSAFKPAKPSPPPSASTHYSITSPPPSNAKIYKSFYTSFYSSSLTSPLTSSKHTAGYPCFTRSSKPRWILTPVPSTFILGKGGRRSVLDATVDIASEDGRFEDTFDHEEGEKEGELGYRSWRGVRIIWSLL